MRGWIRLTAWLLRRAHPARFGVLRLVEAVGGSRVSDFPETGKIPAAGLTPQFLLHVQCRRVPSLSACPSHVSPAVSCRQQSGGAMVVAGIAGDQYTCAHMATCAGAMWPDNETERDYLNFSSVSDTVAEIVDQARGRPISIGVSGAWGTGKSSMIRLVRASLSRRAEEPGAKQFVFVEFNAWLYQGYDDARAALMEVIASKLESTAREQKQPTDKAKALLKRINWFRAAKLVGGSALAVSLGLPPTGLFGEVLGLGRRAVADGVDAGLLEEGTAALTKLGNEASGIVQPEGEASSPPKEIQALRDAFEETLGDLGVTLVVLVDDLDRCLPETTISTLEAIRLFLFLKNAAFVIAGVKIWN